MNWSTSNLYCYFIYVLISCFRKKSSNRVLKETYARLLQPWIEQINEAFQRKNEETKNGPFPTSYNLRNDYNTNILKTIKSGRATNDERTKLINEIINKLSNEAKLSKNEVIGLLLNKAKRNYTAHGCIEDFIHYLINGECTVDDFIQYIENENEASLCISDQEKEILMKLLQYNIVHRSRSAERNILLL